MKRSLLEMLDNKPIRKPLDLPTPDDLSPIADAFDAAGEELYVVGGAVRDALLGKTPKDYDLVTGAEPDRVIDIVSQDVTNKIDLTGKAFGVVRVKTAAGEEYEIATFRRDGSAGRRPDSVTFTTIEDDVNRRDLTINALFWDISTGEVVDYVGGIADVKNGIVRAVGDPIQRFREDKLRILRAVRFAARLGSDLDPETFAAIKHDNDLSDVSPERTRDEFAKGLASAQDGQHFLSLLDDLDLFDQIFPGLLVDISAGTSLDFDVQVALLTHQNDPNIVSKVLRKMKYTSAEIDIIHFLQELPRLNADSAPKMKKAFKRLHIAQAKVTQFAMDLGISNKLIRGFLKFALRPQAVSSQELMSRGFKGVDLGNEINAAETKAFKQLTELRKYIRAVLTEKTFADLGPKKNQWMDVPKEELAVHNPEIDVDDEIFDLIDGAYKPIGGHIKIPSPNDLPGTYEFFDAVDVDDDPDPDSVIFGQYKDGMLKIGGRGHDGGMGKDAGKNRMYKLLKQPGTYVETSGAPAHLALKNGVPAITDEDKVRAIIKKPIEWVGKHPDRDFGPNTDGWYYRTIGGSKKKFLKILVGNI